jgi:hypothetical protein
LTKLDEIRENKKISEEEIDNFVQGVKNYIKYGHATWYSWSIENWGTKWNISDCDRLDDDVFEFTTAWNGIPNIIKTMSQNFPNIEFLYEWSDENTGCNCGIYTFKGGEESNDSGKLVNESKEAYNLFFKLHPEEEKNYKLVDGKYKYIDDDEDK